MDIETKKMDISNQSQDKDLFDIRKNYEILNDSYIYIKNLEDSIMKNNVSFDELEYHLSVLRILSKHDKLDMKIYINLFIHLLEQLSNRIDDNLEFTMCYQKQKPFIKTFETTFENLGILYGFIKQETEFSQNIDYDFVPMYDTTDGFERELEEVLLKSILEF